MASRSPRTRDVVARSPGRGDCPARRAAAANDSAQPRGPPRPARPAPRGRAVGGPRGAGRTRARCPPGWSAAALRDGSPEWPVPFRPRCGIRPTASSSLSIRIWVSGVRSSCDTPDTKSSRSRASRCSRRSSSSAPPPIASVSASSATIVGAREAGRPPASRQPGRGGIDGRRDDQIAVDRAQRIGADEGTVSAVRPRRAAGGWVPTPRC